MTTDRCLQRPTDKAAGATVYLIEELGDARLRCEQLVQYTSEAVKLIENSSERDHFFEAAGHLIQAIPETLFKLQKALQAVALAATRIDYEEIKQELRPEKVDQLERVLQDVRIRQVQRRSDPWTPEQAARALRAMVSQVRATGHLPRTDLVALVLGLEFGLKKADARGAAQALEELANSLEKSMDAPSQLHLAMRLRQVYADDLLRAPEEQQDMYRTANDTAEPDKSAFSLDGFTMDGFSAGPQAELVIAQLEDLRTAAITTIRNANGGRWRVALISLGEMVTTIGSVLDQLGNPEGSNKATALYREIRQTALKVPRGGPDEGEPKMAAEMPDADAPPVFGLAMVNEGLEKVVASAKQAQVAMQGGNAKKMFFRLLGAIDGLGMIGRAYDLPDVGFLMRVWKVFSKMSGARPTTNFAASEEEKESRFEEGKPADPTKDMSPEDAAEWKVNTEKHRDKFKTAAEANVTRLERMVATTKDQLKAMEHALDLYKKDPGKYAPQLDNFAGAVRSLISMGGTALRAIGKQSSTEHIAFGNKKLDEGLREAYREGMKNAESGLDLDDLAYAVQNMAGAAKTMLNAAKKSPLGPPIGIFDNLATAMWEGAYALGSLHAADSKTASSDEEKESKFEEGKPADPTKDMSPEDAAEWKANTEKHRDKFKKEAGGADRALAFRTLVKEDIPDLLKNVSDGKEWANWSAVLSGRLLDLVYDDPWARRTFGVVSDKAKEFKYALADFEKMWHSAKDVLDKNYLALAQKINPDEAKTEAEWGRMAGDEEKESKFEEGKPADPTKDMSPEDAKKWKAMNEEHGDKFKKDATAKDPWKA